MRWVLYTGPFHLSCQEFKTSFSPSSRKHMIRFLMKKTTFSTKKQLSLRKSNFLMKKWFSWWKKVISWWKNDFLDEKNDFSYEENDFFKKKWLFWWKNNFLDEKNNFLDEKMTFLKITAPFDSNWEKLIKNPWVKIKNVEASNWRNSTLFRSRLCSSSPT